MCRHRQQHGVVVLVAISLMAACILHGVSSASATTPTAYDVLEQNNFPRGLLPLGVQSYELNDNGGFEVTFPGECNFFVTVNGRQIKFRFDSTVSGSIRNGYISGLSGASFHPVFALLPISRISRVNGRLYFLLDKSIQSFPVSAFAQSANCSGIEISVKN